MKENEEFLEAMIAAKRDDKERIYAMAPYCRRQAKDTIEVYLENALRIYFQIRLRKDSLDVVHWKNNLKAALKHVVHSNISNTRKGYWFDRYTMDDILLKVSWDAFDLCTQCLDIEEKVCVPDYGIDDLFYICGLEMPRYL